MNNNKQSIDILKIKEIKTIKSHSEWVNTILLLNDNRIASCSDDSIIKIYDIDDNYANSLQIKGHTQRINSICQLDSGNLVSCSEDLSIKVWSISKNDCKCEFTLSDVHKEKITKVISLTNKRFASCSWDNTIKIFKSEEPFLIKMLKNKGGMFSSIIQIKDKELLISEEQTIKKEIVSIWDIKRYQCIMSISGIFCHSANSIVQLDERNVLIGGLSKIVVLNFYTGKIEKVIQDSNIKHVTCICLLKEGKFILCGCEEGKFLLYI